MHPMLNIAVRAARTAGNLIARNLGRQDQFTVEEKKVDDLVTTIDKECESTIVSILRKAYRDHAVLGEESGLDGDADAEYRWIIDPIDGTTNFVQGIPHCAVSIALHYRGRCEVGVVFDPMVNEMFTAARGEGAALNGSRIRVSKRPGLSGSIIHTAPPVRYREKMDAYMTVFRRLVDNTADIRRTGCASLDMAYVACGRCDGYLELGLKPWDYSAGELLVREAGGIVTDFAGDISNYQKTGNILCGSPAIVKGLLTEVTKPAELPAILK